MEIMGCNRFKLVGFEGSFYTELRISILPYLKPTPICKEGTPNQIDKSRFQCLGCEKQNQKEREKKTIVWDERNKIMKKKRRRNTY